MRIRTDFRSLIKGYRRIEYYAGNFTRYFLPDTLFSARFRSEFENLDENELADIERRVSYYARLAEGSVVDSEKSVRVGDFNYPWHEKRKFTTYFFDLFECVRCFPDNCRFSYYHGDIDWACETPTFAKARPIAPGPSNTVILPLNKVRHMRFIDDSRSFRQKKDMLVFRNIVRSQPWRTEFLGKFVDHPLCDVGQINSDAPDPRFVKAYMPMEDQLDYKFIACIEGHDVATNLKWVMSSNSVAIMPEPRMESWFMEGTLIPDFHYIRIKPDYSDLTEKLDYYIAHPDKAEAIIRNAHEFVRPFRDTRRELLIARMTAMRYFRLTGQKV